MKKFLMLACHNIKDELLSALKEANADFPVIFIPREMHLFPDKLRMYLQDMLNSITNVNYILLPMGMCGNGTIGLVSETSSIVLPKCGDCIDLLLSQDDLSPTRPTYNYFLTSSWLGEKGSLDTEFQHAMDKYGLKRALRIFDMMYKNYKYFSFIDTGTYDIEAAKEKVRSLAEHTNVEINVVEGKYGVLRKMAALQLDNNFVIVSPGETVCERHFGK